MNCPKCHRETIVTDSRGLADNETIRRRRKCPNCDWRITTYEHLFAEKYTLSSARKEIAGLKESLRSVLAIVERMEDSLGSGNYISEAELETRKNGQSKTGIWGVPD